MPPAFLVVPRWLWPMMALAGWSGRTADRPGRRAAISTAINAALLLIAAVPCPVQAHPAANRTDAAVSPWEDLRRSDLRLAAIVHRLAVANAGQCDTREAAAGLIVQSLDQYPQSLRDQARAAFRFQTALVVEAVVPDGPADRAGIRADDSVVAIARQAFDSVTPSDKPTTALRDRALALIRQTPPDQPVAIRLLRAGQVLDVAVHPVPACALNAEVVLADGAIAESDDRTIQIGIDLIRPWSDADIAVLAAHEMAHIVLKHGDRISAAHVHHGLLGEIGRSVDVVRAAEDEADRFSVRLLAKAGYDPAIGPQFWRHGKGRSIDPGIFRSANHGSPRERAALMEEEIARLDQPFKP